MRISDWSSDVCSSDLIDSYQEPLVRRQDLTNDLAMRLYWVVAANLRDEILKSYDIHPTDLDDALEGAVLEMAAENRDGDANLEKTAAEQIGRATWRERVGQYV